MKRKTFLFITLALTALIAISSIYAYAQRGYVIFRVLDKKSQEPIIGATVLIMDKGNIKQGATTNLNGIATLNNVESSHLYKVTYTGYKTKTDTIGIGTNFLIELEEDIETESLLAK